MTQLLAHQHERNLLTELMTSATHLAKDIPAALDEAMKQHNLKLLYPSLQDGPGNFVRTKDATAGKAAIIAYSRDYDAPSVDVAMVDKQKEEEKVKREQNKVAKASSSRPSVALERSRRTQDAALIATMLLEEVEIIVPLPKASAKRVSKAGEWDIIFWLCSHLSNVV
jgi:hypothetical protein